MFKNAYFINIFTQSQEVYFFYCNSLIFETSKTSTIDCASSNHLHLLLLTRSLGLLNKTTLLSHILLYIIYSILYKQIHIITRDYKLLRLQYPA